MSLYIKNTCLYIWIKKCYIFNIFKEVDFMKKAINKNVKRATALALSMTMLLGLGLSSYAEGEYNVYDEIDEAIIIDDNDLSDTDDKVPFTAVIRDDLPDGLRPVVATVETTSVSDSSDSELVTIEPDELEDIEVIKLSPNMFQEGAIQKNDTATQEVNDCIKGVIVKNEEKPVVLEIHKDDLNALAQALGENGVDKLLKDTKENLENIESNLKDADTFQKSADEKLTTVLDTNKDAITAAANSASGKADSAKANATAANDAGTLDEATAAKTAAEADLTAANNDLNTLTLAFNTASANVEEVSKQLKAAEEDYGKAYDKVVAAKEELKNAKTNSDKALADLKKAEEEMAALDQEVQKLSADQADYEAMQKQYYAMMVQYFREVGCAVYDENGKLDLDASAEAITQKQIEDKAKKGSDDLFYLGRYLMSQLVTYMINNYDNVDPATANISFDLPEGKGASKNYKTAGKGVTFVGDDSDTDDVVENVEQVEIAGRAKKDNNPNHPGKNDTFKLYQVSTDLKDNGRTNMFYVTYTDKNNNRVTEYYNYVFKAKDDLKEGESKVDIQNGMIYLAVIKTDENGVKTLETVDDENNFSNYSKLVQALDLANKANILKGQYDEALAAVQAAEARTQDLVDQIAKIKITDLAEKSVKLEELKDALKKANEELDKAKEDKTNIEDKIKEVQKAIEDIDLTRFDVVTNDDTTDDTTADPQNIQNPTNPNAGQGQGGAGQQNANIDGQQGQAAQDGNEDLIIDDENSATAASVKVADDEGATRPVFTVTDEASATAASVEEAGANLWWLLLLLLLALMIAFAIYKYAENKRNAEINN